MLSFTGLGLGTVAYTLASVAVGMVGSRRKITFSWSFFLSALFTPLLGLLFTLLSGKLEGNEKRYGVIGTILGSLAILFYLAVVLLLMMAL